MTTIDPTYQWGICSKTPLGQHKNTINQDSIQFKLYELFLEFFM